MRYLKDGYHLEENLMDVTGVKTSIENIFFNYCGTTGDFDKLLMDLFRDDIDGFVGCAQLCQMIPDLIALSVSPAIVCKLKELGLKNPVVNTRPLLSFSSKNTAKNEDYWKIPAHQDWPSTQGSLNGITCWMPLVDVTPELGPLEIYVGSHLNGLLPHTEIGIPVLLNGEFDFKSIPMNANDALFFSNFTVHRSGLNSTEHKIRISMHFRYDDADEPVFIRRKYPRHKTEIRSSGNSLAEFPINEFLQTFKSVS